MSRVTAMALPWSHSWDANMQSVVTGHEDGFIRVWSIQDSSDMGHAAPDSPTSQAGSAWGGGGGGEGSSRGGAFVPCGSKTPLRLDMTGEVAGHAGGSGGMVVPVTALLLSRDHKRLWSGDARGRVLVWTLPTSGGEGGDVSHWLSDAEVPACKRCSQRFTAFTRRHHCRNCGSVVCNACSRGRTAILQLDFKRAVRVCNPCLELILADDAVRTGSSGFSE